MKLILNNRLMMKGILYKLGDGPINYNWKKRFFKINGKFSLINSLQKKQMSLFTTRERRKRKNQSLEGRFL